MSCCSDVDTTQVRSTGNDGLLTAHGVVGLRDVVWHRHLLRHVKGTQWAGKRKGAKLARVPGQPRATPAPRVVNHETQNGMEMQPTTELLRRTGKVDSSTTPKKSLLKQIPEPSCARFYCPTAQQARVRLSRAQTLWHAHRSIRTYWLSQLLLKHSWVQK